jgi:hexosaminidase
LTPNGLQTNRATSWKIAPKGVTATGRSPIGLFYAACTLIQLIDQYGALLPCLKISDRPDFAVRGVMIDISRDKVPLMGTLYELVDMLAGWKINQLQLYTEHTFAYRRHPKVWADASPMTGQEILELDAFCRKRYVELVPNQNSFGHMHRWLTIPEYARLAEVQDGFDAPWGWIEGPFSLCPVDPGSLELVFELYDELLPHFSSRMVNAGCDETFDLGKGRSKEACERRGSGRVYLDFLLRIYENLKERGRTMQFWGDIVNQHPELIDELPRDLIALEWGYEHDHPFAENTARYAQAGIPFYVCPGTSTWNTLAGRTRNALANLLSAAENGLKNGAAGYLITDWGDNGHWQTLPVSYLGFAAGAAYSWALEANRSTRVAASLDRHAFRDRAGVMGALAYELGSLLDLTGIQWFNGSPLFAILQNSLEWAGENQQLRAIPYARLLQVGEHSSIRLEQASMDRPDAGLVRREFALALKMLKHACQRGSLALNPGGPDAGGLKARLKADLDEIMTEYRAVWLARNRPGGLTDSMARFSQAQNDYMGQ